MSDGKTLTNDDYLRAFALFHMANTRYVESWQYAQALASHLGAKDGLNDFGHISDAIYCVDGVATPAQFKEALRRQGFVVEDGA